MPRSQHSEKYKMFCRLLTDARLRRKLTQAELASRLEKPQSFIAKYEKAERRLDVIEFLEIADAIGVTPAKIIREVQGR
jgi:transcriptional regulator with XRE-family HTH domain